MKEVPAQAFILQALKHMNNFGDVCSRVDSLIEQSESNAQKIRTEDAELFLLVKLLGCLSVLFFQDRVHNLQIALKSCSTLRAFFPELM